MVDKTSNILNSHQQFMMNENITENIDSLHSIIYDDAMFASYRDELVSSFSESEQIELKEIINNQRTAVQESLGSGNVTPDAIAYAVGTFAVLTDMYSDELLKDGVYIKPSTSHILTISRNRHIAEKIDMSGEVVKVVIPSAKVDLRGDRVEKIFELGKQYDLYEETGANQEDYVISRNGLKLTHLTVDIGGTESVIPVYGVRFNARGDIESGEIKIVNPDDETQYTIFKLNGNLNQEVGKVNANASIVEVSGDEIKVLKYTIKFRMSSISGSKGIINIKTASASKDIIADDNNPVFKITEKDPIRENWTSIYSKDVVKNMIDVSKVQIEINKNFEIADELEDAEYDIKKNGAWRIFDIVPEDTAPENFETIFKSFLPSLNAVVDSIQTESGMTPNVIMASPKVAILMKSLQQVVTSFPSKNVGSLGITSDVADITKFKVLKSVAIPDNRMYILRKGMSEQDSSIVELSFKPLIIKPETTGGKDITYIRTRTRTEIAREDTIGCIELVNIDKYIGSVVPNK